MDPKNLRYAVTHEWVSLNGDIATIGISKFAVDQLTDLIVIDLPEPGKALEAGKAMGEIESVKAVSDLYSPVDGEVIEINPAVLGDINILAADPYEQGWLVKAKVADPAQVGKLLSYADYEKAIAESAH